MSRISQHTVTRWGIWATAAAGIALVWSLSHRGVIARSSERQLEGCCAWAKAHNDVELLQVCERGATLPEILDVMNSRRAIHVRAEP